MRGLPRNAWLVFGAAAESSGCSDHKRMALRLGIVCSMLPMFRSKLALHRPFSSALSLSLARQLGFIPSSPVAGCRRCVLSSQSHVQKSQLSIVDEDGDEILHLRGIEDRGTGNADAGTSGRLGDDFGVCTISGRDLWLKGLEEEAERMYLARAGSVQASTNLKIESWEQGYVSGGQWKISSPLGCSSCGDDFWTGIVAVDGTAASSSCAASCFSDIACESQRFPNLVSDGTELIGGVWGRRRKELGSVSCRTSRSQSRFFSAVGSECHWLSSPGRFPMWFRDGASQSPRRGTAPRYMYSTGAPVSTESPVQTDGSCDGEYGAVKPLREIPTSSSRPTDESENSSEGLGTSGIPSLDEGKLQMWRGDSVPGVDQKPKSESELRSGCGPCYVDGGEPSTVSADDEGGESQMQAAVFKALEQSLGSPLGREPQVPRPKPLVIVISGPSGVGKDVVIKRLQELRKDVHFVVTATTRPQRPGEVDGLDYFFVSKKEFVSMVENGELLEHALVYGDYKGIPKQQVRDCMARGTDVVLRVDVQGAATVRSILGSNAVFIFLVAENETSLVKRLLTRKTETLDKVILRIATAREELKRLEEFDYAVVNADGQLDRTVSSICCIIDAEKARVKQRVATI